MSSDNQNETELEPRQLDSLVKPQPTRKLKIGMVCPYSFDEPGGVQVHAVDLCQELQNRGHEVSLIGPGEPQSNLPSFVELGGASIPIRYNGSVARLSFGPKTWRHLRLWIRRNKFDVVHIHEPNSPSYSLITLVVAEGALVATYHASASESKLLKIALPVLRPLLEKIRGGIAVSEEARRWQVEMLAGDPVLIPNGVDTMAYRSAVVPAELETDRPRLMFLGRFDEPRKGLHVLLSALPKIVDKNPTAELLIAGGGEVTQLCERLDHLGLSWTTGNSTSKATVRIMGRVSDEEKAAALKSSDIYIAPNTGGESFGIVLVEAMAAGTAVVASDIPAFVAVGDNGNAAALFANGQPEDLAERVCILLADHGKRASLAKRGRERSQIFDWSTVASQVEEVYNAVVVEGQKVVES